MQNLIDVIHICKSDEYIKLLHFNIDWVIEVAEEGFQFSFHNHRSLLADQVNVF